MDVAASFQFVVDALADQGDGAASGERYIVAADWRGFGLTQTQPLTDAYWFPDYLGDLDALADRVSPNAPFGVNRNSTYSMILRREKICSKSLRRLRWQSWGCRERAPKWP